MRAGLYVRVSKGDESQNPDNQLIPLHSFAKAMNWEIVKEYVDYGSGGSSGRQGFLEMLDDSDRKVFDVLLVWAWDRFTREGISNALGYLKRLKNNGVAIKSLQETWLDTRDESIGELLLAIFSWLAEQERKRIIERTKAGLERARRGGKRLGRPVGSKDTKKRKKSGYYLRYSKK